ncbi:hypothetical protein HN51_048028, partial [Arachis hypogaea]
MTTDHEPNTERGNIENRGSFVSNMPEWTTCYKISVYEGCEKEVAEAGKQSNEFLQECLLRLSWAPVHSNDQKMKLANKIAASGYYVVIPDFFYGEPYDSHNTNRPLGEWLKDHGTVVGLFRLNEWSRHYMLSRVNGIDFEQIKVDISKGQHLTPDFTEVNPLQKVPAIVHGNLKLSESAPLHLLVITGLSSHAILVYLASAFTGIADHWYLTELSRRAKINSQLITRRKSRNVVIIHHLLYDFAVNYVILTTLVPALGRQLNPKAATEAEKFNGDNGGFLCDSTQPSVADLSMVCELMQLEVLDERDRSRILSPYKKILQWIENTRNVKLDIRTKLCLRDSLYRLAKSAEQRHNDSIANGCTRDDQACKSMVPHNGS